MVGLGMDNNVAGQRPWRALARLGRRGNATDKARPARSWRGGFTASRHQIMTRCAAGKYILSPSLTSNAL